MLHLPQKSILTAPVQLKLAGKLSRSKPAVRGFSLGEPSVQGPALAEPPLVGHLPGEPSVEGSLRAEPSLVKLSTDKPAPSPKRITRPSVRKRSVSKPSLSRPTLSLSRPARLSSLGSVKVPGQRSGKTVVGLDIEPGSITAVVSDGTGSAVSRAATLPLGAGIVREGEVAEPEALTRALEELFTTHRFDKNVRIGLANQRIVMRTMDLPPLESEKEIASAVQFSAQEQIPMPLDEAVLQHRTLGLVETPDGTRTRVVLIAARRDMVNNLVRCVRAAGLKPAGIDLSAFAIIRALHDPARSGGVLYLNVGGITNLAVAESTNCLFTRTVMPGMESMAEELAERCGITLATARRMLRQGSLTEPLDGHSGDPQASLEARSVIMAGIARISDEVRNTLAFHAVQPTALPVQCAVLTGSAGAIGGFAEALGAEIGLPTQLGVVREAGLCAFGGVDPSSLTVAAGLTVEQVAA